MRAPLSGRPGAEAQGDGVENRLRAMRAARGWTQAQLGAAVGVSRQAIIAIETERHDPSLEVAFRLSAVFGAPVETIFVNAHRDAPGGAAETHKEAR